MRIFAVTRSIVVLFALATGVAAQAQRVHQRFDANWKFKLEPNSIAAPNEIPEWLWRPVEGRPDTDAPTTELAGNQVWLRALGGDDVFHGRRGFAWFDAILTKTIPPGKMGRIVLHFESVDDNATVYINGKRVLHHEGWNDPFDVPLNSWTDGQNDVRVLVENTDGPGGIGAVRFVELDSEVGQPNEAKPTYKDAAWRTVHLPHRSEEHT